MSATHPSRASVQTLPDGEPLIRLQGVGRRYAVGDQEVVALADVSLEVRAEEFVVVLGPSGCGKTTLFNMIGALDSPTEGGRLRHDAVSGAARAVTGVFVGARRAAKGRMNAVKAGCAGSGAR